MAENEIVEVESEVHPIVSINDNGKKFEIVGKVDNWEDFFLDKENFVPIVDFVKERVENLVADPTTTEGVKVRKALKTKIGGIIKAIDEKHDEIVKALKDKPKRIDAVRKIVKDTLTQRQKDVMKPVEEIEARQQQIVEISNIPAQGIGCDSHAIRQLIETLDTYVYDKQYWAESFDDATFALNESRRQLNTMLEASMKQEEEKREYERLKAEEAERNRKLAEEAAKAKAEAEEARRKVEEAEAARKKAEEDAAKSAEEAERARKEASEAQATAKIVNSGNAESVLKDAEITRADMLFPDDDAYYRKTCKTESKEDLMACGLSEEQARDVVIAILNKKVRHVMMLF